MPFYVHLWLPLRLGCRAAAKLSSGKAGGMTALVLVGCEYGGVMRDALISTARGSRS
jgi:hypothetical protein